MDLGQPKFIRNPRGEHTYLTPAPKRRYVCMYVPNRHTSERATGMYLTCYTQQAYNTPRRIDLGQPRLVAELKVRTHLTNHAFSSIPQKEQQGCTWTITCYTQQAYNAPRRIDLGQPKLVAELKVRTHLTNPAFSSIPQKEQPGCTWTITCYLPHIPLIQHTSSYGLRLRTAQISCRTQS